MDMRRGIGATAAVGGFLLFGLACGLVGQVLGSFQGFQKAGHRSAEAMANSVYRAAQSGTLDSVVTDKLSTEVVIDSLREFDKERGPVRSWRVLKSFSTPIGLPMFVNLEVQRKQASYETLVIHSPFRFHDHFETSRLGGANADPSGSSNSAANRP